MRRVLALLLVLLVMLGALPVGISASATGYTDFVKGSISDNLVVNFTDSFWHANTLNDSKVDLAGSGWINGVGYAGASMTAKEDITTVASHYGSAGMVIGTTTNATYPKIEKESASYKAGEHYVFMFAARNINPDIPATIRVGVFNGTYTGLESKDFLPVEEYPNGEIELPQSGEWVNVRVVLPVSPNRTVPGIRMGFVKGTVKGASVEFNAGYSGIEQVYYGKETAHDIKASIVEGESTFGVDSSVVLEAAVYNQLDKKGNLSQEFEWALIDEEGNTVEKGYTFDYDANSGKTTFTNKELGGGKYNIVATSKEYKISRFIPITVVAKFEKSEHIVSAADDNLITTPTKTSMVSSGTSTLVVGSDDGLMYPEVYRLKAKEDISGAPGKYYEHGILYKKDTPTGGYKAGDKYVFRVWARNIGTESTNIIVGVSNAYDVSTTYGAIYGAQGMTLPADGQWHEYIEVLTIPGAKPMLSLGLPAGTKAGSYIEINLNKAGLSPSYFAKEEVYDITAQASKTQAVKGETIDIVASVVNQLGKKSGLSQNFEWFVLDENKNYKLSGYTLTQSNSSAQLTVTRDKAEIVYIAAVSKDYNIVRMIPLSLNGKGLLADYVKGDMPQNLIRNPAAWDNVTDSSGNYDMVKTGDYRQELSATYTARNAVTDYGKPFFGASGFLVKTSAFDLTSPLKGGASYVFGVSVKNANGTGDIVLDVGLSNTSYHTASKPQETSVGYTIPAGDDWYNLAATMKLPGTEGEDYNPYLIFGFGKGTDAGDKFEMNMSYPNVGQMYFAPEVAYDIEVEADDTTVVQGEDITFNAKVLNQLGSTGYLEQNFTWYVRAWDNTDASASFEITQNNQSLTVSPNAKAKGGKYSVIAVSDEYKDFVRFKEFFVADETTTIYVSTDGNDTNTGSAASPLATLAGAIKKISELKSRGVTVNEVLFYPGEYQFTETVGFTKAHKFDVPVTFRAMEKGKTIFKTAKEIDASAFKLVEDETIKSRFASGVEGKIYSFDLAAAGYTPEDITDITQINGQYSLTSQGEFNTLYYNGIEQTVSQWPDGGDYATKGDGNQNNGDESNSSDGKSFTYYREDVENMLSGINCDRWKDAKNFWISSFEPYDYSRFRYYVKAVDTENHTITICDNPSTPLSNARSGRWKAHNLIEEITLPGEYAIDTENMILYYYPMGSLENAKLEFSSFGGNMVTMQEASNIIFDSITFARTRGSAVSMTNVSDIQIVNCDFRDIASEAISGSGTSYAKSGRTGWQAQRVDGLYDVIIKGNNFENIGQTAIQVSGSGNLDTLTPSGVVVEDNYIHNTSNKSFWEAIILGGCGVTVRNNNISTVPMQAIRAWGNNHLIEYNEIYDVLFEDADCGAIYWGGSSIYQGTVVRYNYIHDTDGDISGGQVGVYWDDGQLGQTAKYNIFANQDIDFNSNGSGATVHHYNTTYNANTTLSHQDHSLRKEDTVDRDVFYGSLAEIRADIANLDLYYKNYPYLKNVIEDGNNPTKYTSIKGNLAVKAARVNLREVAPKYAILENNTQLDSTDAFSDVENQDFRLRADSELAKKNPHLLNTQNFDIEKIGLARDIYIGNFSAIYPSNKGRVVDYGDGITLLWNRADGANRYDVVVATDADFNDVVYSTQTYYNSVNLPTLAVDTYYWKVTALNTSREFSSSKQVSDGVRSFTITDITVPIYVDHEVNATNAINNPAEATNYNQFNTSSIHPQITGLRTAYKLTVKSSFIETAKYDGYLSGFIFRTNGGDYLDENFTVPAGEKLILKIPVRNTGSTDSVRVNASLINSGNWGKASYSLEYGEEGVLVTNKSGWTELVFTFVMPGTPGTAYKPRLMFGFPQDAEVGSAISINLANYGAPQAFVGRAEPLQIDINAKSSLVKAGSSVDFTATVTDLSGSYKTTSEDVIKCYVTNERRNQIIDDPGTFVFTRNTDNIVLKVGPNVEPGQYFIVVESAENSKLRKGMAFEVTPADITVTKPVFTSSDTLSFAVNCHNDAVSDFNVYVAGYDIHDNLVYADTNKISGAANGSSYNITSKIPDGKASKCISFKIFTWKEGLVPLAGGYKTFYKE